MKATVVEIQSRSYFRGGKHRIICLSFDTGDSVERLRLPEPFLGIVGLALDDEVEVSFAVVRQEIFPGRMI